MACQVKVNKHALMGKTVATTPGSSGVFNELLELVAKPMSEKQYAKPLLICCRQINKSTFFDLS